MVRCEVRQDCLNSPKRCGHCSNNNDLISNIVLISPNKNCYKPKTIGSEKKTGET